jgi:hypothetical protein
MTIRAPLTDKLAELRYCAARVVHTARPSGRYSKVRADWLLELEDALNDFENALHCDPVFYKQADELPPDGSVPEFLKGIE